MNHHVLLKATFALLLLAMMPLGMPPLGALQSTAHAQSEDEPKTVNEGYFYGKPSDGSSVRKFARRSGWFTLTRGHDEYVKELREAGYQGDVIQYFLGLEVQGPGPYADNSAACDENFQPANNSVAYQVGDFCSYVHPNESWFLHNGRGERLVYKRPSGDGWDYQMDPQSEGWRSFFRERAVRDLSGDQAQDALGFDGIFFDNIPMRLFRHVNQLPNSDGTVREYSDDLGYREDVVDFLRYQREALREHGKLWANMIDFAGVPFEDHQRYIEQLDGYMSEAWGPGYIGRETSPEEEEKIWRVAEDTLKQGKEVMAVVQGDRGDHTRQRYGLASFLLVSSGDEAYFRYASLNDTYTEWWEYSNYNINLGAPKGARYQSGRGWRRDFECGYVTANLEKERGEIVQRECGSDLPDPPPFVPPSEFELPGRIQAEHYAEGEGTGYYDTTDGNQGGRLREDDVDIQRCSDGPNCHHVSHMKPGEWLVYKVNVKHNDQYIIRLRVAARQAGKRVRIEVDGEDVTGSWSLPGTDAWNQFETTSMRIGLSEGRHTIKVSTTTGWFNLNYIDVVEAPNE